MKRDTRFCHGKGESATNQSDLSIREIFCSSDEAARARSLRQLADLWLRTVARQVPA